jgi:hypothetical protein
MHMLGGKHVNDAFDDEFFYWWSHELIYIDDYPCASMDFCRDREPTPPPDSMWEISVSEKFVSF